MTPDVGNDPPTWVCPTCDKALQRTAARKPDDEGALACSGCAEEFPFRGAIPRFVAPDNYASTFGFQWNRYAKTQLDSYSRLPISRQRLIAATGWPERMEGQQILEAGSGAGRFTEVLAGTGAQVFSFDYSWAVDANFANNGGRQNVHLFQADIRRIPLRKRRFDKVLCLGVLQHTPDPEEAFHSLARCVRPGGHLVIDVYRKSLPALLHWKYLLRPVTRQMNRERLYRLVCSATPALIPTARFLRSIGGQAAARLVPILEYSHLGLAPDLNADWAILDTFDMYSPRHDHPQTLETVRGWFSEAGFSAIDVHKGLNGIVGRGAYRG